MGIVGLNGVLVPGRRGLSQKYAVWGAGNEMHLSVNCHSTDYPFYETELAS
jgi:hypothetical protein